MKIEKINDRQIRFILTGEDLAARNLRLSELAYGNEKARRLFQDMMQEAFYQYGFAAENTPIMIEAIPLAAGSIVLVVTKVDNPEELDTRFSSFAPMAQEPHSQQSGQTSSIIDQLLQSIYHGTSKDQEEAALEEENQPEEGESSSVSKRRYMEQLQEFSLLHRLYRFDSMGTLLCAVSLCSPVNGVGSTLYRDEKKQICYLSVVMKDRDQVAASQKMLAALSEYGTSEPVTYARLEYLGEHCVTLLKDQALERLTESV